MNRPFLNLLLADDDGDDCMLFKEALKELPFDYALKTVSNGEQLMNLLNADTYMLPDILFLDLNMPRKTGYECLSEIKLNDKLKELPVVIYSTSLNHDVVDLLYKEGAHHYIRKPGDFSQLKNVILEALAIISQDNQLQRSKANFVIQVQ